MAKIVKADSRYRITIPDEARRQMGIQPGDLIIVRSTGPGTVEIKSMSRMTFQDSLELFHSDEAVDMEQLRRDLEEDLIADALREFPDL